MASKGARHTTCRVILPGELIPNLCFKNVPRTGPICTLVRFALAHLQAGSENSAVALARIAIPTFIIKVIFDSKIEADSASLS